MIRLNRMLRCLFTVLLCINPVCYGAENIIKITQQQIDDLGIKLGNLEPASHVPLFSAPATVSVPPAHEFVVSAAQAGLISKMNVALGDKVNKGDILAVINSPELLTLQGNYVKASDTLKLAAANYNRDKKLLKEGVVSGRNEQQSSTAFKAAWVEMKEARQLLQIAGMSAADLKKLDSAGKLSSQAYIHSPISGSVLERMAVTGSRVDNLTPLYRIANLDELWLEINIPQEHIGDLKTGDALQVENGLAQAVLKVLGESVNPETQTVPARAVITGHPATLRVGQKVTVQAIKSGELQAYQLPDKAIARHEGKTYIFIRNPDGFKVYQIRVLGQQPGVTVIGGDLTGAEEIAVGNAALLKANWLGLGSGE